MIEVKNVTFRHRDIEAIKDIDMKINKGEFIAIIGKNGSGKSTLAKLISGIILPKKGDIYIDEINTKDKKNWSEIRKKTGIVFQNPENQLVFANVEDDIKFMLENFGYNENEIKRRIEESLEKVGMKEFKNREIYELPMGQKQRIAIAEMLALEPEYLILDEPTAMLDPATKPEFLNIINDIRKRQDITILYVTNVVEEILSADRIIALDNGRIAFECNKKTILNHIQDFKNIGLIVPKFVELVSRLQERGVKIPNTKFDIDSIIEGIESIKNV